MLKKPSKGQKGAEGERMNDVKQIAEKIVARGASINPLYVCGEIVSVPELAAAYLDLLKRTESHVLRSTEPLGDERLRVIEAWTSKGAGAPDRYQSVAKKLLQEIRRLQAELKTAKERSALLERTGRLLPVADPNPIEEALLDNAVDLLAQLQTAEQREKEAAREWLHLDAARQMLIEERDLARQLGVTEARNAVTNISQLMAERDEARKALVAAQQENDRQKAVLEYERDLAIDALQASQQEAERLTKERDDARAEADSWSRHSLEFAGRVNTALKKIRSTVPAFTMMGTTRVVSLDSYQEMQSIAGGALSPAPSAPQGEQGAADSKVDRTVKDSLTVAECRCTRCNGLAEWDASQSVWRHMSGDPLSNRLLEQSFCDKYGYPIDVRVAATPAVEHPDTVRTFDVMQLADRITQMVAEIPDRFSPEDDPRMMMVRDDELRGNCH